MRFRKLLLGVLSSLALAVAMAAPSAAAAAEPVGTQGCQGPEVALYYYYVKSDGTTGLWSRTCSGTYPLNSRGIAVDAGSWSGSVTLSSGSVYLFCDWDYFYLEEQRVVEIYMSATRASWC